MSEPTIKQKTHASNSLPLLGRGRYATTLQPKPASRNVDPKLVAVIVVTHSPKATNPLQIKKVAAG